jgi:DNA-binding transcriptional LysR family regulator
MFAYKHYVYEVYKQKSFSKAAQNLYISQPSLSARIIKIEEELGMPIFDRSTSHLRLTEFGEYYIKAIEDVTKIEKDIETKINDILSLRMGELCVGASNVFAAYILPPIISEFKDKFPKVNIKLIEGNTTTLEKMLADNDIDLVIDNNHYDGELYDKELYLKEQILLAVPKIFPEYEKTKSYSLSEECIRTGTYKNTDCAAVPLSAFSSAPFIMLTPNNDTRIRGDKMCKDAGFHPDIALEVHQQATAYMISTTNLGATFISDTVVQKIPVHDSIAYYKLDHPAANRAVYFYFKKHKYKTKAMQEFMQLIAQKNKLWCE